MKEKGIQMKKIIAIAAVVIVLVAAFFITTGMGNGSDNTSTIVFSGDSATVTGSGAEADGAKVTISDGGTYTVSGESDSAQILIKAGKNNDVTLILNGVNLTNADEAVIYEKKTNSLTIETIKDTENIITSGTEDLYETALTDAANGVVEDDESEAPDADAEESSETEESDNKSSAAIYAKNDLTIAGSGTLTVNGYINNGIQTKDDLEVDSGTITVTASNDGLKGKDSLTVKNGTITVMSAGDALVTSGNMDIEDGTYTITTGNGASASSQRGMGDFGGTIPDMSNVDPSSMGDFDMSSMDNFDPSMMGDFDPSSMGDVDPPQQTTSQNTDSDVDQTTQSGSMGMPTMNFDQDKDSSDSSVSQKGFKADGTLTINGGTYEMNTADDSFHSADEMVINDGTYTISSSDDGMHADNKLTINAGTITVNQSVEGIEAIEITVNDGNISVTSSDDGFNARGGSNSFGMPNQTSDDDSDSDTKPVLTFNGGNIYVNADGDGLDSNGDLYINGGSIYVDGPANGGNSAVDIGTENQGIAVITGGTLTAIGYSTMAEDFDSSSTQYVFMYGFDTDVSANTEVIISDSEGNVINSFTTIKSSDCIIFSSAELKQGETYTITAGDQSGTITLDSTYVSNVTSSMEFGGGMGSRRQNSDDTGSEKQQSSGKSLFSMFGKQQSTDASNTGTSA